MRIAFGRELAEIFRRNRRHKLFCGDIGFGVFDALRATTPEQFHNFGISEQHMISFASAFSKTMQATSLVYTINPFITSRVHDQLRVDVAYSKAPLIICSVGAGFAYDSLGFTHYGLDDLSLVGSLPNIKIFTPSEPGDVTDILQRAFKTEMIELPIYLRLHKGGEPSLRKDFEDFKDGRGFRRWKGNDIEIVTHGAITLEALRARAKLAGKISVGVTSIIDWNESIEFCLKMKGSILFVEEHRNTGLLAHRLLHYGMRPASYEIACVENSEFDVCLSRDSALRRNHLDSNSLVLRVRNLL
jgi:transketolase